MPTRYFAITLLLVCASSVSRTERIFSQPFHHSYSSNTSINCYFYPLLSHCYIQEYHWTFWSQYCTSSSTCPFWPLGIYKQRLISASSTFFEFTSVAVEWLNTRTAVNEACLHRILYYYFVSRFYLLACSHCSFSSGFGHSFFPIYN